MPFENLLEVTVIKNKLTAREREFCLSFMQSGDAQLSARRAGFRNPDSEGERLLCNEKICAELERLSELRGRLLTALSVIGYQRLAFGSAADAASLLFEENPSRETLGKMDLFLVSEIRRPKDGAMEIKFFDRARALEKLASLSMERESSGSLYDAIGSVAERSEGDD
ncbi:MAG: terminase small subunit [Ruminococcus sp.]|uniref:terminase small subunit n=1 Tax=Ruminococcus sp. JE7B6 TaxID=3233380 RepID=UPI002EABC732|nr:terminase small subunit [Ruminococcus sp.]MBQ5763725.1 terminase small subunit [Ruminococcus sp.]MEE0842949.1 terminase small subunit [Ruminococcus sp.]